MKTMSTLLLFLLSLTIVACSEDEGPTNPDPDPSDEIPDGVIMKVNGVEWKADTVEFGDPILQGGDVLKVVKSWQEEAGFGESIGFSFVSLDTGTYTVTPDVTTMSINFVPDSNPGTGFEADPVDIATGELIIVENTTVRISGRFSFSGTSAGGTAYVVTDGTFSTSKE